VAELREGVGVGGIGGTGGTGGICGRGGSGVCFRGCEIAGTSIRGVVRLLDSDATQQQTGAALHTRFVRGVQCACGAGRHVRGGFDCKRALHCSSSVICEGLTGSSLVVFGLIAFFWIFLDFFVFFGFFCIFCIFWNLWAVVNLVSEI
jgi:hypothetical protein